MRSAPLQLAFPDLDPLDAALRVRRISGAEERGAIFTRREVVEFILDLAGYTEDQPLADMRLLEPSFGGGDFLLVAVERLLGSYRRSVREEPYAPSDLIGAVRAVELHGETFAATRAKLLELLVVSGFADSSARVLADSWLAEDDFLLREFDGTFTHVVGNPPYVRQEAIPDVIWSAYRERFATIYDRADLYVPFIEKSLGLLRPGGRLGFICADRWMKNRYGGPLRRLVSSGYHLESYVDMVDTPAFHTDVAAYPAITVIAKQPAGPTRVARRPELDKATLSRIVLAMRGQLADPMVCEVAHVATGSGPWVLEDFRALDAILSIESRFGTLEEAGCNVGIGVATGADRVFIGLYDGLDVEPERKLPLVTTGDIVSGIVQWQGKGVVNPFEPDGTLADLAAYPRFRRYLEFHRDAIQKRHVAHKNPNAWYRTIDRIYAGLTQTPKLLIPDIKGEAHIVFEEGRYYPHHNLYYVVSDEWDLRALQAVLRSTVAQRVISAYSTRMRGGYLRFQAQYLRKIRLPQWRAVSVDLRQELIDVASISDAARLDDVVFRLYGLSTTDQSQLRGAA